MSPAAQRQHHHEESVNVTCTHSTSKSAALWKCVPLNTYAIIITGGTAIVAVALPVLLMRTKQQQ